MTNRNNPPNFEGYRPDPSGRPGAPPRQRPVPGPGGGRGRERRQSRSGGGIFSFILYTMLALVVLVGAGIGYLVAFPPTELIKAQVIDQVRANTGRSLSIDGATRLTFYPSIGVEMDKVRLGPPPGMGGADTVRMDKLQVAVDVLPLLSRNVSVDKFILTRPVFDLRVDKAGRKSWDLGAIRLKRPIRYAQAGNGAAGEDLPPEAREFLRNATPPAAPGTTAQPPRGGGGLSIEDLKDLSLGDVRIVEGTVNYSDDQSGARERIERLNVALALATISKPLDATGDLVWKGEKVAFEANVDAPEQVLTQKPAKVSVTVAAAPAAAGFEGRMVAGDVLSLAGPVSADAPSVRRLAAWLGTELPPAKGFGPLKLQGQLNANGPSYKLSGARIDFDGATAEGDLAVRTDKARPFVTADLKLDVLDLNKYITSEVKAAGGSGGTRVKGSAARNGWSTDPINLAGLTAVDVNAKLGVDQILFRKIRTNRSDVDARLNSGKLTANLTRMQLYEGQGKGLVTVDAAAPANPAIGAGFTFNNVSAQPLLKDAADLDWLSGRGTVTLNVSTRGGSQFDLVKALNGKAAIDFADGAIEGFNFAKLVRSLSRGDLGGLTATSGEKTDFSALTANFDIKNGVVSNNDMQMLSPLLRVNGAGKVMLPPRQVDYTVTPRLVSSLTGQGGEAGLEGLAEVPVRIHGDLDSPKYTPKLDALVKDPSKTVETIKNLRERFKGKDAGEIVNDLLGGGSGGEGGEKKIDGKELLRGLFGR